ncbi:MAG: acid phosphatase, partial [Nitrospiraceae bacterium]
MGISILSGGLALGDDTSPLPRPDHIVIVIEENHSYSQIIDSPDAPYINKLAAQGAVFTQSFGVTYPSQPNYLA